MKIKRAVKCAAEKKQLSNILEIAEKTGIHGLEIQEVIPLIKKYAVEKRAEVIINSLKKYPFTSLSYHFPLPENWNDISKNKSFDLAAKEGSYIFTLTEDTIKEAVLVGKAFKIKTEIPIVVHLFGLVSKDEITLEKRNEKLKLGEKKLLELKEIADYYSKKTGLKLTITRENHLPHQNIFSIIDFHPKDIMRTANSGIGTCLDISHLWLTILYYQKGKGNCLGVDFNKTLYPETSLEEAVALLKPSLKLLHMSDAGPGYQDAFEGLEIGKGNLPHSLVIPLICKSLKEDIIGTYEIKEGHKKPETIFRSDQFYRKLFKEKFKEYFK